MKSKETKIADFILMPGPPDKCPECAADHDIALPHNQQSLYYQYYFYANHSRWPTWEDAMEHCSQDVQIKWTAILKDSGIFIPDRA